MKKLLKYLFIMTGSLFIVTGLHAGTVVNLTLTNPDTEYSVSIPRGAREYSFQARTAQDIRFSWVTGKVATPTAPYATLKSGNSYTGSDINKGTNLYFASSVGGTVVEITYE